MATTHKAQSGGARSTGSTRGSQVTAKRAAAKAESQGTTVHLPYVTAELHRPEMPDLHVPDRQEIAQAVDTAWENLPSRGVPGYFAGPGVSAALSMIEWPVAAVVGVGTIVTQRAAGESASRSTPARVQNRSGSASV